MEIKRAAELLRGLADGRDPITGARLPDEQIARCHGRTAGAIEARLSELGRRDQIQFNMR